MDEGLATGVLAALVTGGVTLITLAAAGHHDHSPISPFWRRVLFIVGCFLFVAVGVVLFAMPSRTPDVVTTPTEIPHSAGAAPAVTATLPPEALAAGPTPMPSFPPTNTAAPPPMQPAMTAPTAAPALPQPHETSTCGPAEEVGPWPPVNGQRNDILLDARDGWIHADFWSPVGPLKTGYDEVSVLVEPGTQITVIGVAGQGWKYAAVCTRTYIEQQIAAHQERRRAEGKQITTVSISDLPTR